MLDHRWFCASAIDGVLVGLAVVSSGMQVMASEST